MEYVYKGVKYNRIIIRSDRFSKPVRSKTKQNYPKNLKYSRERKVKSGREGKDKFMFMKTIQKVVYFILFSFLAVSIVSCSKHLSRAEAKEDIVKKELFPKPVYYSFEKIYTKDEQSTGAGPVYAIIGETKTYNEVKNMLSYFEMKGLIRIQEETHSQTTNLGWPFGESTRTWISEKIILTDVGNKYLNKEDNSKYEVKIWDKDILEITGIEESKQHNSAEVIYTTSNKNITPFGEYFNDKSNISEHRQQFYLYNDGWRIY